MNPQMYFNRRIWCIEEGREKFRRRNKNLAPLTPFSSSHAKGVRIFCHFSFPKHYMIVLDDLDATGSLTSDEGSAVASDFCSGSGA
jgi:hypothetical protein